MPELPDITVYLEALRTRVVGRTLQEMHIRSPFLVRSVEPSVRDAVGRSVVGLRRLGKRIVWQFDDELFWVLHLMIAGRLRWKKPGAKPPARVGLAAFDFDIGTLVLTEASKKKRASLYAVQGEAGLLEHNPGGVEVLGIDEVTFAATLAERNHTLKRALTDPRIFSGIGNAYSDEILHRAKLSPLTWTTRLTDDEVGRLHEATVTTLEEWCQRLRDDIGAGFPDKVTAFRSEMAVHGKFGEPCPVCQTPVQRIRYAENETNYCPGCQTDGKLLADRGLSRLLKQDWPKSLDDLESLKAEHRRKLSGDT